MLVTSVNPNFGKSGDWIFLFKKPGDFSLNRDILKSHRSRKQSNEGFPCGAYVLQYHETEYMF